MYRFLSSFPPSSPPPSFSDLVMYCVVLCRDHTESVRIEYDPTKVSYDTLLQTFWKEHDASSSSYSVQYRSAIFPTTPQQMETATKSKAAQTAAKTAIEPFSGTHWTDAEEYHQKYLVAVS